MYHKGNRLRLCISQRMSYDEPLMKFWDLSLSAFKLDTEIKARIIGVKVQMEKLKFFYGLSLGQRLFSITENLSKMLPSNVSTNWIIFCQINNKNNERNAN